MYINRRRKKSSRETLISHNSNGTNSPLLSSSIKEKITEKLTSSPKTQPITLLTMAPSAPPHSSPFQPHSSRPSLSHHPSPPLSLTPPQIPTSPLLNKLELTVFINQGASSVDKEARSKPTHSSLFPCFFFFLLLRLREVWSGLKGGGFGAF